MESLSQRIDGGPLSGDQEGELSLRKLLGDVADKAARGGRADHDFMSHVVNDLRRFRDNHPALQVDILLEVAKYFFTRAQDAHRGLEAAALAVGVARKAQLKPQLRRALSFQGVLSMSVKHVRGAIDSSTEALELAVELGDRAAQCAVSNNIGGILLDTHFYEDALHLFRFAVSAATGSPDAQKIVASAMSNMALCYLNKHQYHAGSEAVRAAIHRYGEPANADELVRRVLAEWCYTRLLLAQGKVQDARLHAALAKAYAARADSTRADLYSEAAEALCDAFDGKKDLAWTRLIVVLEGARVISSAERDVLASVIQAAEYMDDVERSDYYRSELTKLAVDAQAEAALDLEVLHSRGMKRERGTDNSTLKLLETHYTPETRERVQRAIARAS